MYLFIHIIHCSRNYKKSTQNGAQLQKIKPVYEGSHKNTNKRLYGYVRIKYEDKFTSFEYKIPYIEIIQNNSHLVRKLTLKRNCFFRHLDYDHASHTIFAYKVIHECFLNSIKTEFCNFNESYDYKHDGYEFCVCKNSDLVFYLKDHITEKIKNNNSRCKFIIYRRRHINAKKFAYLVKHKTAIVEKGINWLGFTYIGENTIIREYVTFGSSNIICRDCEICQNVSFKDFCILCQGSKVYEDVKMDCNNFFGEKSKVEKVIEANVSTLLKLKNEIIISKGQKLHGYNLQIISIKNNFVLNNQYVFIVNEEYYNRLIK